MWISVLLWAWVIIHTAIDFTITIGRTTNRVAGITVINTGRLDEHSTNSCCLYGRDLMDWSHVDLGAEFFTNTSGENVVGTAYGDQVNQRHGDTAREK